MGTPFLDVAVRSCGAYPNVSAYPAGDETMEHPILEFYTQPSVMTSAGRYASLFDELPSDMSGLVRIIQHLVVYDVVAPDFYSVIIPDKRQTEIHIRSIEKMLDGIFALDDRPLSVVRSMDKRLAGRCHHFMLFLVAILRAKGIPAPARCGFGSYFNPPFFEDHWVCEYWNATEARWVLVDAQFDDVWCAKLKIDHDILDVPRDRFLVAGDAWVRCRKGEADPAKFGIGFVDLRGLWYIAGSLVRDLAALNKMEMLPWDVWGAQSRPDEELNDGQLAFFDRIAALTREPDASFDGLRRLFEGDERLRVPAIVFNALLNRSEAI
jgi:hypothetical protein